jgi:hypothetical protein
MGDTGPRSPSATRIGDEQAPNKWLPLIVVWLARSVKELAPAQGLSKAVAAWCWGQRPAHRFSATSEVDRARARRLAE